MDTPVIETQQVVETHFVIKSDNNVADIDDVINILTVMTNSDKKENYVSDQNVAAANYLEAAGLIEKVSPNTYSVKNMDGCVALNDQLSESVEGLIKAVKVTSSHSN